MSDVAWIGSKNIWTDVERLKKTSSFDFSRTLNQNTDPVIPSAPPVVSASEQLDSYFSLQKNKWLPKIPLLVALFTPLFVVSMLVLLQSLELYRLGGFHQPELAAVGALFMMLGFAGYRAAANNLLSLVLCFYAGAYETYLMTSGTFQGEKVLAAVEVEKDEELIFLKEKLSQSRAHYAELKSKHETQGSKFFENTWYKQNHVEPAWKKYEDDQRVYLEKKEKLSFEKESSASGWLKVFYRLGLVFLSMILIHSFIRQVKSV